eukprot:TRINITY_DN1898_c0_g1_i3.p1 TRINITY_DN1898_c0_g1~~TRINITY_DN1898_c0_g1_i3.p1  ORF type:complete len:112 (-),score=26.64 TRINITY_DN1898_c0_g1_i3:177-512(-)
MARNTGSLLAVLLAAACCYLLAQQTSTFLVPQTQSGLTRTAAASTEGVLAEGAAIEGVRDISALGMKAQVGGKPNRINLLYLATLLGTLVIGLIFTLGYGGYSGPGSSEIV